MTPALRKAAREARACARHTKYATSRLTAPFALMWADDCDACANLLCEAVAAVQRERDARIAETLDAVPPNALSLLAAAIREDHDA